MRREEKEGKEVRKESLPGAAVFAVRDSLCNAGGVVPRQGVMQIADEIILVLRVCR